MNRPPSFVTLTLNPAIDHSVAVAGFRAGEVHRVDGQRFDPGGKGINVAACLADLGQRVTVSGWLGADNAAPFERLFREKGLHDRFLRVAGATRVNIKIIDAPQQRVSELNFPGQPVTSADIAALRQTLAALLAENDCFVLSGSMPADVPVTFYAELVAWLRAAGKQVALDSSGAPLAAALDAAPQLIKPNRAELAGVLARPLYEPAALVDAARRLLARGIGTVIVSVGAAGALFATEEDCLFARPPPVTVRSTVGAGDALLAGFLAARAQGQTLAQCARWATATAVGALTQIGPRLPSLAEIEAGTQRIVVQHVRR
ncbi:MAG TPA: 1-phosphofructokinase [Accumulibacter sp.]|nr:1-phosphofructokinase [Accumulibacter sp.]